jgi:hypothetical protein
MKLNRINRYVAIAVVVLPLILAIDSRVWSQRPANSATNKEVPLTELLKLPGKTVSEAKSSVPSGDLKLTGHRVEEVQLPENITVERQGQRVVVNRAWRVSVQGGPFPVRALPPVIWIDDQIVGNGVENETLSQITAVTFDGSVIRDGGVVSVSYGQNKEDRIRVPQGLQLKRGGENQ